MVMASRSIGPSRRAASARRLLQPVQALPERAGQLERRHDAAGRRHLRRFQVRAADVEAR